MADLNIWEKLIDQFAKPFLFPELMECRGKKKKGYAVRKDGFTTVVYGKTIHKRVSLYGWFDGKQILLYSGYCPDLILSIRSKFKKDIAENKPFDPEVSEARKRVKKYETSYCGDGESFLSGALSSRPTRTGARVG